MSHIVVSPILRFILRRVVDQSTASTYHDELDQICKDLLIFNSFIVDVEQMANDGMIVYSWLRRLRDLLEVVDNLIDEVQMMSSNNQQSHLMPKQVSFSLSRFNPFSQSKKLVHALQAIALCLNDLGRDANYTFGLVDVHERWSLYDIERHQQDETSSDVNRSRIIGREKDEEAVIDLISKSVAERVSVIPIVGFMGVGKTTLAQLIYNNPRRIQHIFDLKLWVYLPLESHDNLDLIREILGKLRHLDGPIHDYRDAEQMKTDLHELLEKKRFFIVLDGFEDINLHKSVVTLLQDMGSEGSAIIVTTRSRRAASLIGTTPPYQLDALPEDASYHLFTKCCRDEIQNRPEWEPVARDMVKSCNGVPLFLQMLALRLRDTVPEEWEELLQTSQDHGFANFIFEIGIDKFKFKFKFNDPNMLACPQYLTLPIQSLPLQEGCGLSVEALTCVWMALGFLYSDDPTQQPEQIARKYLREIIESGLCPDVEYAPGGVVRRIKFNDTLHEFAMFIAGHQWGFIPPCHRSFHPLNEDTRYIIWDEYYVSAASKLSFRNQVRLFILCSRRRASAESVKGIISDFKCLRVLGFGECNIEMLLDSIGELKHLRYLDVGRNARMKRLPASICDLWHLQTLFLHGCSQLEELPANIGRLENLRYLTLTILKESLPKEMGKLTSLRTLALASCPRLASLPSSLKNLKNIQTLGIVGCQDLDLIAKSSDEGLKGLDAINTLLLSHLPKFAGLPTDLGNPSIAMKHLMIQSCPNLIETTWIMQFRSLRSLTIEDCPQLSALTSTDGTSKLDGLLELVIRRCPSLGNTEWIRELISLRSLIIDDCPKLVELDAGFSEIKNLKRLEIRKCPVLAEWFASPAGQDWLRIVHVRVIELDGVCLES